METTIAQQDTTKAKFLENFQDSAPLDTTKKVAKVREEGKKALENELSFPTTKVERWKYTRVKKILNGSYTQRPFEGKVDITPFTIQDLDADQLVFVDGYFREDLSSIADRDNGIRVTALSAAEDGDHDTIDKHYGAYADHLNEPFTALNAAFATDGAFIHVPKGKAAERPVHIIHLLSDSGVTAQQRNLIVVEQNAELKIVQSHHALGGEKSFNNVVNELVVDRDARLYLDKIQNETEGHFQIATDQAYQDEQSTFSINTITLNGGLVRNDLNIVVDSEHCETHLCGLYVLRGKQHVDNHTLVHHKKPNCHSNELYKGIMDDKSTGVFNGKVFVHPHAQKIDAYQSNANVLVSDDAKIYTKPELEIYADDVSCSHGSTTGQLDEEAMHYLRSRGIDKASAEKLLIHAFASELLDKVHSDAVRSHIEQILEQEHGWNF